MARLSFAESCQVLQTKRLLAVEAESPLPPGLPQSEERGGGVRFFRTVLAAVKLERLTLPRTFFGRSEIREVSFRSSDLTETTAHWNDFIKVNFSEADLSRSDLRACVFERVRFVGATLAGVDFRYCGFKQCDFSGADVTDAKFTIRTGKWLQLSAEQRSVVDWQTEDGDEPEGG